MPVGRHRSPRPLRTRRGLSGLRERRSSTHGVTAVMLVGRHRGIGKWSVLAFRNRVRDCDDRTAEYETDEGGTDREGEPAGGRTDARNVSRDVRQVLDRVGYCVPAEMLEAV